MNFSRRAKKTFARQPAKGARDRGPARLFDRCLVEGCERRETLKLVNTKPRSNYQKAKEEREIRSGGLKLRTELGGRGSVWNYTFVFTRANARQSSMYISRQTASPVKLGKGGAGIQTSKSVVLCSKQDVDRARI